MTYTQRRQKLLDRAFETLWADEESRQLCLTIRYGTTSQQQAARDRLDGRAVELGIGGYLRLKAPDRRGIGAPLVQEWDHIIGHAISCSFK